MNIKRRLTTTYIMEVDPYELAMLHQALEIVEKQILQGPTPAEKRGEGDPITLFNAFIHKVIDQLESMESALLKHQEAPTHIVIGFPPHKYKNNLCDIRGWPVVLPETLSLFPIITCEDCLNMWKMYRGEAE